jgi:hypothetical protein
VVRRHDLRRQVADHVGFRGDLLTALGTAEQTGQNVGHCTHHGRAVASGAPSGAGGGLHEAVGRLER